jgi:hypothetical protein
VPDDSWMAGHLSAGLLHLLCHFHMAGYVRPADVSPASCHCCTTGHLPVRYLRVPCHFLTACCPSAGDGQFLLGFVIFPRQILRFLAAVFRRQFSVPTPFLLRSSDRHYFGIFYGDLSLLCRLRFPAAEVGSSSS